MRAALGFVVLGSLLPWSSWGLRSGLPTVGLFGTPRGVRFGRAPAPPLFSRDTAIRPPGSASGRRGGPLGLTLIPEAIASSVYGTALAIWTEVPGPLRVLMRPRELLAYLIFRTFYSRVLRLGYFIQTLFSKIFHRQLPPPAYLQSVLGFLEPRFAQLSHVTGLIYLTNVVISALALVDLSLRPGVDKLLTKLAYTAYGGYFLNELRRFALPRWFPKLAEDKRRSYIVDRSCTVIIWTVTAILILDNVSQFFKVPLSSSLALGGVGGVALGLASKDVVANFVGGLMLLLTEPFTPGDMITFLHHGEWVLGKVERVGWYQTRVRNRDTRPTYVPNAFFVHTMVTNMDRITHRKFEADFQIQLDSFEELEGLLDDIKLALQAFPKLDLLSPFRAHLTGVDHGGLKVNVLCYFATKSFDEFLALQQKAFMEVARCIELRGLTWAFPRSTIEVRPREIAGLMVEGMMEDAVARQQNGQAPQYRRIEGMRISEPSPAPSPSPPSGPTDGRGGRRDDDHDFGGEVWSPDPIPVPPPSSPPSPSASPAAPPVTTTIIKQPSAGGLANAAASAGARSGRPAGSSNAPPPVGAKRNDTKKRPADHGDSEFGMPGDHTVFP